MNDAGLGVIALLFALTVSGCSAAAHSPTAVDDPRPAAKRGEIRVLSAV